MAARSLQTGTISFGLVTVPIRLYSAAEHSAAISFNMLHARCGSRLKQQYICPQDEEIVTRDQTVRGYEFAKDQYVTFTEDELKAMQEASSQAIEISEFVPLSKVDPIYFEGAYYVGPDKGGERSYALLAAAMRETGRSAIAKWKARGKMYVVLIRPIDKGLIMQVLHYADEVRSFDEVPLGDAAVKETELKLAVQLIDQISVEDFNPAAYEDEVKKRYQEAIQRKVEGQEITATAPEAPRGQIIDLMEALKASLAKSQRESAVEEEKPAAARATRANGKAADTRPQKAARRRAG
ncbi:MAG TPA: Ku protein [Vicinamibacteria bacterium]|nr:Ku protein [Vicinamibacteria bacterium]